MDDSITEGELAARLAEMQAQRVQRLEAELSKLLAEFCAANQCRVRVVAQVGDIVICLDQFIAAPLSLKLELLPASFGVGWRA